MRTHPGLSIRRASCLLFVILALACGLAGGGASVPAEAPRIVAVGDVHGAFPQLVTILQRTKLVDDKLQWTGGSTVLVQTGDLLDRGDRTRECLDLLMELERQALQQNGRVIPLLGNHEAMNMMGDLRYVSAGEYRSFATEQSEKAREQAYLDYRKFLTARSKRRRQPVPPDDEESRQKWMNEHPAGFLEHSDAFGPRGVYGRWFRKHDTVAQVGDIIFLHGGLSPKLKIKNVNEINDRVRSELALFDSLRDFLADRKIIWRYMRLEEIIREVQEEANSGAIENDPDAIQRIQQLLGFQKWLLYLSDGPLWYRGYSQEPEDQLQPEVDAMLQRLKAHYIVVAHSPTTSRQIMVRGGARVFLIDTGMLQGYFQGRASALEIQNGRFTGYYSDKDQQVLLEPAGTTAAQPANRGNQ